MRLFLLFVGTVAFFLLSTSCKKYKAADPAFFIRASQVKVTTDIKQGSGSHKITDLWLYVNGQFQGAYPVGHLMPIVNNNQKVKINVFAGIKNNGISDTRIFSNFYKLIEIDTLVTAGTTIERPFTFEYNPAVKFAWIENFDAIGTSIQKSDISETTFTVTAPENSFEGKSIEMALGPNNIIGQLESSGAGFELPVGSSNVYLELNYKCNEEFSVGLIGDNGLIKGALNINPQAEWNKIYIQLSGVASSPPVSSRYKVYFRLLKKNAEEPRIFLDNIKLVYL